MTPTEPGDVRLRRAEPVDLPAIAELHMRVRQAAYPHMPRGIHTDDECRAWVAGWDLVEQEVWVAEAADGPVGYARVHVDWLEDLYVDPAHQGTGVGKMLLDLVMTLRPGGFGLWVFESNAPARAFYGNRGLVEVERTDGSGNEEKAPDIRMSWPGRPA